MQVGTGVGNPGRTIASLTGAHVTGVTINAYQIKRALYHTKKVLPSIVPAMRAWSQTQMPLFPLGIPVLISCFAAIGILEGRLKNQNRNRVMGSLLLMFNV